MQYVPDGEIRCFNTNTNVQRTIISPAVVLSSCHAIRNVKTLVVGFNQTQNYFPNFKACNRGKFFLVMWSTTRSFFIIKLFVATAS